MGDSLIKPIGSPSRGRSGGKSLIAPIGTAKGKKRGKSVGGFLGNVAGNIRDATVGAVPAIAETGEALGGDVAQAVEDTVRVVTGKDPGDPRGRVTKPGKPGRRTGQVVEQVGRSYAETYGPLVRGDWRTFLDNVYNDPVFIALDAATVASLGLGAGVKVGVVPSRGGKVLELTTPSGKTVSKPLARGELRAQLQNLAVNAENRVRPGAPAARQVRTGLARRDANVRAQTTAFNRSLLKLRGKHARVAAALHDQFDRQALNEYVDTLRKAAVDKPGGTEARTLAIITHPKVQAMFDRPTVAMAVQKEEARALGKKQQALLGVSAKAAEERPFLPARVAEGARLDNETGEFVGGPSIDELIERGLDPVYLPHTATVGKGPGGFYTGKGGGVGIPKAPGNIRQNRGSLMLAGQLVLDPAVLNESFLRSAKYAHYQDVHEALIEFAVPSDRIPAGYQAIRRRRSERVSPMDKTRSNFEAWSNEFLDDNGDWKAGETGLTTRSELDATRSDDGRYMVVPERIAKQLTGEFVKQGKVLRFIERNPIRVWRALVLNLRPAYLVNNVVGNTLLYLVHSARPEDLRQLADAFKQFAKPAEATQIDRLLERHFGGQVRGGFVATQLPQPGLAGSTAARAGRAVVNAIPSLDKRWEQALRRAKVKAELKRHPELRDHAERMGSETEFFKSIEGKLDARPDIVNQVYDRVNDALGNYDTMTAFERTKIRSLFPFYAWYKAISGVTGKLVLDQPVKANLLARLGQIAVDNNIAQSGLTAAISGGLIPTGKDPDGRVRGINTTPMSPWATVGQLAQFATSPARGAGGLALTQPGLSPVWSEVYGFITGRTPEGYPASNIPGWRTIESLPFTRLLEDALGTGPKGDTLNDRDLLDELLRYLGVPYARRSPTADRRVAERVAGL